MNNKMVNFRVDNHVKDVKKAVNDKINLALFAMGEVVEGYAKDDCPVDTGLLRNSITHATSGSAPSITSYSADKPKPGRVSSGSYPSTISGDDACEYVGSNVEYAPDVEFLNRSHLVGRAHFLRDAAQNHVDELKNKAETIFSAL